MAPPTGTSRITSPQSGPGGVCLPNWGGGRARGGEARRCSHFVVEPPVLQRGDHHRIRHPRLPAEEHVGAGGVDRALEHRIR